jgi:NitT/TauT family transport system ATP-binding protein
MAASQPVQSPAVFECRDLAIDFETPQGTLTVLENVSFQIGRGEFVSIVGGSGTGKTTLLRILGGLAAPRPGSVVEYHGQRVVTPPEGVAFVFQDYRGSLLPWRNVLRNVELGIEATTGSRTERRERAQKVLSLVGLEQRGSDYPSRLSGGMQQRVQIARALAMQPEVLLMDEPFGALDAMTKAVLQDELLRLHRITGTTVLFVTHDIEEAVYLSDRVVVLSHVPARIAAEFAIDLPRPRDQIITRGMPEYLALRQQVHASIGHP